MGEKESEEVVVISEVRQLDFRKMQTKEFFKYFEIDYKNRGNKTMD